MGGWEGQGGVEHAQVEEEEEEEGRGGEHPPGFEVLGGWVGGWVGGWREKDSLTIRSFTHPPTHPYSTVARSNRTFSLYPTHPPTHPPTYLRGVELCYCKPHIHDDAHREEEDSPTQPPTQTPYTQHPIPTACLSSTQSTHPPTHPPTHLPWRGRILLL